MLCLLMLYNMHVYFADCYLFIRKLLLPLIMSGRGNLSGSGNSGRGQGCGAVGGHGARGWGVSATSSSRCSLRLVERTVNAASVRNVGCMHQLITLTGVRRCSVFTVAHWDIAEECVEMFQVLLLHLIL